MAAVQISTQALPTLIGRIGPFMDASGNLWVICREPSFGNAAAYESTDGGATWSLPTNTGSAANDCLDVAFDKTNGIFYVLIVTLNSGTGARQLGIWSYTISSNRWAVVAQSGTSPAVSADASGNFPGYLARRSDGSFVVAYQGPTSQVMGKSYRAVYLVTCSAAGAWGTATQVSTSGITDGWDVKGACVDSSDTVYVIAARETTAALQAWTYTTTVAPIGNVTSSIATGGTQKFSIFYDGSILRVINNQTEYYMTPGGGSWSSRSWNVGSDGADASACAVAWAKDPSTGKVYAFYPDTAADEVYYQVYDTAWAAAPTQLETAVISAISAGMVTNGVGVVYSSTNVYFDKLSFSTGVTKTATLTATSTSASTIGRLPKATRRATTASAGKLLRFTSTTRRATSASAPKLKRAPATTRRATSASAAHVATGKFKLVALSAVSTSAAKLLRLTKATRRATSASATKVKRSAIVTRRAASSSAARLKRAATVTRRAASVGVARVTISKARLITLAAVSAAAARVATSKALHRTIKATSATAGKLVKRPAFTIRSHSTSAASVTRIKHASTAILAHGTGAAKVLRRASTSIRSHGATVARLARQAALTRRTSSTAHATIATLKVKLVTFRATSTSVAMRRFMVGHRAHVSSATASKFRLAGRRTLKVGSSALATVAATSAHLVSIAGSAVGAPKLLRTPGRSLRASTPGISRLTASGRVRISATASAASKLHVLASARVRAISSTIAAMQTHSAHMGVTIKATAASAVKLLRRPSRSLRAISTSTARVHRLAALTRRASTTAKATVAYNSGAFVTLLAHVAPATRIMLAGRVRVRAVATGLPSLRRSLSLPLRATVTTTSRLPLTLARSLHASSTAVAGIASSGLHRLTVAATSTTLALVSSVTNVLRRGTVALTAALSWIVQLVASTATVEMSAALTDTVTLAAAAPDSTTMTVSQDSVSLTASLP